MKMGRKMRKIDVKALYRAIAKYNPGVVGAHEMRKKTKKTAGKRRRPAGSV